MKKQLLTYGLVGMCCVVATKVLSQEAHTTVSSGKILTEYYVSNALVRATAVSTKTNAAGSPVAGYTKLYQNGKLAFEENWGPGTIRQRTFFRDEKPLMTQTDKDGDGVFEWVVVTRDDGEAYAIFQCPAPNGIRLLGATAIADYNIGLKDSGDIIAVITNTAHHHAADK